MIIETTHLPIENSKAITEISEKKLWITPTHEKIEVLLKLPILFEPDSTGSA